MRLPHVHWHNDRQVDRAERSLRSGSLNLDITPAGRAG
jgi:hypothetical protein